jgi:hypothetical protein
LNGITAKDAKGKDVPVSFQALDDVRRNLGEVFRGKPPEGYAGIDADTARKYYRQISDLQEQFAGDAQAKLQRAYADSTAGMEIFGSRSGKRATALDGFIEDSYKTDPSALPKDYFSSKTKINDLIALTGDRNQVVSAASDYAATGLRDLNEKGVRNWMSTNRELLATLPEVRDSVLKYANSLARGESIANSADQAVKRLSKYSGEKVSGLNATTGELQKTADAGIRDATTRATQDATTLIGSKGEMFGPQEVKSLILNGDTNRWSLAAPAILRQPNGQQNLVDAVRQTLAEKATQSTNNLANFFENNVRPALEATKIMKTSEIDAIQSQLSAIENMKLAEPVKIGLKRRVVLQAFGGYASGLAARGATETGSGLVNLIPQ